MTELSIFCNTLKDIIGDTENLTIERSREVIKNLNEFLYTNYPGIGTTYVLENTYDYISDFHKYWESNYEEILQATIDDENCTLVANALHEMFVRTGGRAFSQVWNTHNLPPEVVCQIRFLTANQDFRGSRDFSKLVEIYNDDPTIFDIQTIEENPEGFINHLGITGLSQNDKRIAYARNIAHFISERHSSPYDLPSIFNNDVNALRNALITCQGAGYGNKKADMFIRDMVVLEIWPDVQNFECIDVASDINTIKVALRTGILKTAIPLLSSFLDIFCYQYSYIDRMNAAAWRRVWTCWQEQFPTECISSPCLMDYFVYNVVGKQFCKESLAIFQCDSENHTFKWHSSKNRTCQTCYSNGHRGVTATCINKVLPCEDPEGRIAILHSDYVRNLPNEQRFEECPFKNICDNNGLKTLQPPKSISILGQTGWISSYTGRGNGGGGLMA